MLEIILIGMFLFLILTFFYKQAICEFRINQVEWGKRDTLQDAIQERVPTVLRGIPQAKFWTQEDVMMRASYGTVSVFDNQGLPEWLTSTTSDSECPWTTEHASSIASVSGLITWAERWINENVLSPIESYWYYPKYLCFAGSKGLHKTVAPYTLLTPTEGEIIVNIMPENVAHALPVVWKGTFPSELTQYDTPFINDLKFMDIIIRPGTALIMPAHWFISWKSNKDNIPLVCSIEYHSPISRFALAMGSDSIAKT